MLQFGALSEIYLDNLFKSVTKKVIVRNCISNLEVGFIKGCLGLSTFGRCLGFAFSVDLSRWVEDLVKLGLSARNDVSSPLSKVFQVVDQLKLVQFEVGGIDLSLFLLETLSSRLLREQIGKFVKCACDRHIVEEQLNPLVPVARINLLGVKFLLVIVSFISNVHNLIEKTSTQL